MPGPQFSTPSLQELLLTARTGADQGAGAISGFREGFSGAMDRDKQARAAEIKAKLEGRAMALQETTQTDADARAGERIAATEAQTKATKHGIDTRSRTAAAERKANKEKRDAAADLDRAQAEYYRSGQKGQAKRKAPPTDVEIDIQANDEGEEFRKRLLGGLPLSALSPAKQKSINDQVVQFVDTRKDTMKLERQQKLAIEKRVTIITPQGVEKTLPESQVKAYFIAFPGAKLGVPK